MKAKIVTYQELTTDNPTFCLSPLRVFGDCHKCELYKRFEKGLIKKLDCKPQFSEKALTLIEKRKKLRENFSKANQELKAINQELEKL